MKKRLLALLLSAALILSLTTPALADVENGETPVETPVETVVETPAEEQKTEPLCDSCEATLNGETIVHAEGCPTLCECTPVDGVHTEGCPLYEEPDEPADGEGNQGSDPADPTACETCGNEPCTCEPVCPGDDTCTIEGCQNHIIPAPAVCAECGQAEGHTAECSQFVDVLPQVTFYQKLMAAETLQAMYETLMDGMDAADELSAEDMTTMEVRADALYTAIAEPTADDDEYYELLVDMFAYIRGEYELNGAEALIEPQGNVYNVTQDEWYSTLSAATAAAKAGDTIEVYESFTETTHVKIQVNGLTIRAADGENPVVSWRGVDATPLGETGKKYATVYNCVVVYSSVSGTTTLGGGTGTLTIDASGASSDSYKNKRARVLIHVGSGTLKLLDGIVLTGGNPGGGSYEDKRVDTPFPSWSGEIVGEVGFGAGIYMYNGTLNMSGGIIRDNYSLWGATNEDRKTSHNYVGGGGGVYLFNGTTMNMAGGTITHNAAGSGGGAGILVGHGSKLNVSDGTISENVVNFASGGGIGVRTQSEVTISGGNIINNRVTGHGGGLFARGDSIPLQITGGTFEGNTSGGYGGGVLFWTVGDDVSKNTVVISGNAQIKNNTASRGGGVSVGREVQDGKPIGNKAKLIIEGNPVISGNTATTYGGGIEMQSDEFSTAVNTVEISGGTISGNEAKNGAGIYVPGGTVTMTGGLFDGNKASDNGGGIFTGGGSFTISNGTFKANMADGNGGGIYMMNNGSITMTGGTFGGVDETDANTATNGGAVYVTDGHFTMISGSLVNNEATSHGGGAFVHSGNITIGVAGCEAEGTNHSIVHTDKIHPKVIDNKATFGGGLAVDGGNVDIHCGQIISNDSLNNGTGMNIFMYDSDGSNGGVLNHNDGTIGNPNNHGIVAIGGTLNVPVEGNKISINYHSNDTEQKLEIWVSETPESYWLNLPYCPDDWESADTSNVFVGWTVDTKTTSEPPPESVSLDFIRDKDDYKALGDPVEIKKREWKFDETENMYYIDFYAVWAPLENGVSYEIDLNGAKQEMTDKQQEDNTKTYTFSHEVNATITMTTPIVPGYTFLGWKLTPSNETISNWGTMHHPETSEDEEATYFLTDATSGTANLAGYQYAYNGDKFTLTTDRNFGNIKMTAIFEAAINLEGLTIEKTGVELIDAGSIFVFHIVGNPANGKTEDAVDMYVSVKDNGSKTIMNLPVGEYIITEETDWSWRYEVNSVEGAEFNSEKGGYTLTISDPNQSYSVTFNNKRINDQWLDGNNYCQNIFDGTVNVWGEAILNGNDYKKPKEEE